MNAEASDAQACLGETAEKEGLLEGGEQLLISGEEWTERCVMIQEGLSAYRASSKSRV